MAGHKGARAKCVQGWPARRLPRGAAFGLAAICVGMAITLSAVAADEVRTVTVAPAAATTAQPAASEASPKPDAAKPGDQPPNGEKKPGGDKKPDGEKKPDGQAGDDKSKEKKPEETQPVKRPAEPTKPANPDELNVRPDETGMVSFSFKGQPWQPVLEWLADISHMSLDWQEIPGGYLDLTTRRKYTVDEARDLINSTLRGFGYTLLRNGEVLVVANLKSLDGSLVPLVLPSELDKRGYFEVVHTFFDLERLQAEIMAEELKPLINSTYGKINALKTTNRIDVLETAGTLRKIRDIIGAEQGESGKDHQLREFKLKHARVDDVLATLKQLLGIQPDRPAPMSPQEMQQQMQMQQQMMQQMQQQAQQNGGKAPPGPKQEEKIYLAINRRENSIMALATPDKLAIIENAVGFLDVPSDGSPLAGLQRVQIYRLAAAEPGPIVATLKDLGNLDPSTQLQVDNINKAIIVNGPLVDHVTVRSLIEKLDGSTRRFEVIQLRKLDADFVAGSIEFLFRGPDKNANRPRYVFGNYQTDQTKAGDFQVEADTKNNRLLLRVNDIEFDEIIKLMKKLGEDPLVEAQAENMRVIHSTPGRDTDQLLDRLKRLWPTISPTPLELNIDQPDKQDGASPDGDRNDRKKAEKTQEADQAAPDSKENPEKKPQPKPVVHAPSTATAAMPPHRTMLPVSADLPSLVAENDSSATDSSPRGPMGGRRATEPTSTITPSAERSPISITRGPQGLIVTSRDAASLDQLMKLIDELSPNDGKYHLFSLKHSYAKDVAYLLEGIFKSDDKKRNVSPFIYLFDEPPPEDKQRNRLSKREPLKFTADSVTNSILVQNADDEQLANIKMLIDFYDKDEPPDSQSIRRTEIVSIKYAKAKPIADVVKEVYRDLLSPNDKALATNQPQQQQQRPFYSIFDTGDSTSQASNLPKFKGLLSIGIDETSNTLVVSAPQFLLTPVTNMIKKLDESTKPAEPVVQVISMHGMMDDPLVSAALKSIADPSTAKANAAAAASAQSRRDGDRNRNNGRGGPWNRDGNNNSGGGNNQNNNR
jgi:type II secretory pathway component GspD/PulD (secretin)